MSRPFLVLAVDDQSMSRDLVADILAGPEFQVQPAASGPEALALLETQPPDLVLTDLMMPGMDGLALLAAIRRTHPDLPVILVSAHGTIEKALEAIRAGAFDFVEKPLKADQLRHVVRRALRVRHLDDENRRLREIVRERYDFPSVVAGSAAMRQVVALAERVAAAPRTTVLLLGESGTGKEVIARAIHAAGAEAGGRFVAVNCAAVPESLLESELFGHVRGAFTGADRAREGKLAQARGGTLLLDEVGDLPLELQAKLLRVLEERTFEPVGSNLSQPVDLRIIAATNRELEALVEQGRFRADLFHRLNVFPIYLPPLRQRREDLPALTDHFLAVLRSHLGKRLPGISRTAAEALAAHDWPGNVRELRNSLERAAILVQDELIRPEHLAFAHRHPTHPIPTGLTEADGQIAVHLSLPRGEFSQEGVCAALRRLALEHCRGNKSRAAELLKISRMAFYR